MMELFACKGLVSCPFIQAPNEEVVNLFDFFEIPSVDGIIFFSVAIGNLCSVIAFSRGRLGLAWFFVGLLLNAFSLMLLLALPSKAQRPQPRTTCSNCKAFNCRAFQFCSKCGKPLRKGLMTVAVHHFQIWNNPIGDWGIPEAKRTEDYIAAINGVIIQGTMQMVRDSELDSHGRYFPQDDRTQPFLC